jgi:hypothetical protein
MKTLIGALSLLLILTFVGTLAVKNLQETATAAGGASAVIHAPTTGQRHQSEVNQFRRSSTTQ